MKHMTRALCLLAALVLAIGLFGCGQPATSPTNGTPDPANDTLSLTDLMGTTYTRNKADVPQKIVSLTASNTEILFALGLGDKVVGVDAFSDTPAEAQNKEIIGDYNGPNLEKIVALEPDLIVAGNKLQKETIEMLRSNKLTVICAEASTLDEIEASITLIGAACGVEGEAAKLLDTMNAQRKAIVDKLAAATSQPKVYYAMSYGDFGDWSAGPGSFIDEMIGLCQGKNVTHGLENCPPWPMYALETLISDDPDIILLSSDTGTVEAFTGANGYKDLRACKEGKVYLVDANATGRPGPRIYEALEQIAKCLHPELF
nr:ABC transporter substrate-binding protein [bacterium]